MQVQADNGDILKAQIDEFCEVYGCIVNNDKKSLVRCYDCTWESCPMRGKTEN